MLGSGEGKTWSDCDKITGITKLNPRYQCEYPAVDQLCILMLMDIARVFPDITDKTGRSASDIYNICLYPDYLLV